jgi:hypothetical protein
MAAAKALKRQKIALQFMPICDATQQHMHSCGYNPLLELTVSVRGFTLFALHPSLCMLMWKVGTTHVCVGCVCVQLSKKASSVYQHLSAKWSQAQLAHDIYVMIPACPGSSQYSYLDLQTEAPLAALLASWAGCCQLQLLYGFRKHAISPAAAAIQVHDEGTSFLRELGLGPETCMAVLNQLAYTSQLHATATVTATNATTTTTAITRSSSTSAVAASVRPTKPVQQQQQQQPKHHSDEFQHFDCHDPGDAQSFLLPDGTNTIFATAAAMLSSNTILTAGCDEAHKNGAVLTPQKHAREDTKPFAFEDSLASFGALFPDDSPRALILENLSLLYSPSTAHTSHSVHNARGQRRPQAKDGKASGEVHTSTRRSLVTSSPFKEAVRTAEANVPSVGGAAVSADLAPKQPGKENEAEIRSPFAAIIAMHNASPKGVDAKLIPQEHVQHYSSPGHAVSKTDGWRPEESHSGSKRRHTPHSQDSNSASKRRQTPLSQEAKQRKRIRPTFVGSLDSATLRASRNDSFVR